MTKAFNPTRVNFCIDLREQITEVRTHMEWLTSGAAPAFSIDEELDGLSSKIWDVERLLMSFSCQWDSNASSSHTATTDRWSIGPDTVAVVQLDKHNLTGSPLHLDTTRIEAVA